MYILSRDDSKCPLLNANISDRTDLHIVTDRLYGSTEFIPRVHFGQIIMKLYIDL